jgi:subtilisin family serine protease/subtilase family serine protease
MRKKIFFSVLLAISILALTDAWAGDIHPALEKKLQKLTPGEKLAVIVELKEQLRFSSVLSSLPGIARRQRAHTIVHALQEMADRHQGPLRAYLKIQKAKGEAKRIIPFWVFNGMAVTATEPLIRQLAARPDVSEVRLDSIIPLPSPFPAAPNEPGLTHEWNIEHIRAPEVWALDPDYNGSGSVVGIFDTGVDLTHPDLISRYRGDHQNSWYDPYDEHVVPYDPHGHGTHCAGTAVGGNAGGSYIGVAPGATWIAAKAWDDLGIATASAFHQIFQWFLAPGGNPDNAPDVVNNSWSFTASGCDTEFLADIQAWRAAGIFPAFAAGNSGPYPQSVRSPAAYPESFAVGATDSYDDIALFSGRGPSPCDGSIKPAMSAPGVGILSAYPLGYATMSGTSMATPHIAGAAAVLLSINPAFTVDQLEIALSAGAVDLAEPGLDNDSGAGRLDLYVSAQIVLLGPDFPVLGVLATQAVATEAGPTPGAITISRTGNTDEDLEVNFSISGTATPVADYDPIAQSIVIPAGSNTATVYITPVDDDLIEVDETVTLTILSDAAYFVPGSATATVTIDSDELFPDLDITSMSSPTTGSPGASITISDTTKNIGGGVADESVIQFYLSADNAIDISDTILGSRTVPALSPGVSDTGSITTTIPEDTSVGTWYIIAEADSEKAVLEDSEINNTHTRSIGIGPDLDITSMSSPTTGSPGSSVIITDITQNLGGGVADGSATQFFLSADSTIDPSDTLLGGRSVPSLESGAFSSGSTTVTIPEGTTSGNWFIVGKADGEEVIFETVETNNVYVRSITIGSNVDLNIPVMSAPIAAGAGESIVVTDTTKNIGTGIADPSVTLFYLSTDSMIDASDVLLGSRSVPSLAAGVSSAGSTTITIPQSTAVGTWYVVGKADGEEVVSETSETNNTYVRTVGIGVDLDITSMSSPTTGSPGSSITITDTTKNIGGGVAEESATQFYLSADSTIDPSDTLLGSRSVPSLAAGASSAGSTTVTIPQSTAVGTWYIVAKADGEEVVSEISETNNMFTRSIGIGPDLDITSMSSPTTGSPGSSVIITDTTQNLGGGVAEESVTQFFLSADSTIDPSDTLLGGRSVSSLAAGAFSAGSTTVAIPEGTTSGNWFIVGKADGEDQVTETNENNNIYVRSITIGSEVDLTIAGLSAPSTAGPGNSIDVTDTTRNVGTGIADPSVTQLYLSTDSMIDASDVLLGSRSVPSLAAGASSAGSTMVTIPQSTAGGTWYIVAKADGEEILSEASETNNTYARVITIGSDVDLDITSMSSPTTGSPGSSITITDTTKNIGYGVVGPTFTHFYLSIDGMIDASDLLLGSRSVPSLAAGASSAGSTTVTIPQSTAVGTWYIMAKADGEDLVAETSETNNTYTRTIRIGPDLDITSFKGPSSAYLGQSITLRDSTQNIGSGIADPSLTQFYLSTNGTIDASDILLGSRSVPSLAAGAFSAGSTTVVIPEGTTPGRWFIVAKADGEDLIAETSETNNIYVRSITIRSE